MMQTDLPLQSTAHRWMAPVLLALAAAAALPAQAVTVTETGDAGQTLATAQITTGAGGALTDIFGSIGNTTDADLYRIMISSPSTFSASTFNTSTADLDTQLFLFTATGAPVYLNDDASGTTLLSTLQAGNPFGPLAAGTYYLGISLSGYDPVNTSNQLLFANFIASSTETRGPAFGLQPATLGGFTGGGTAPLGAYDIRLTGASVSAVPEPASALMLLLGGGMLGAARMARRKPLAPAATPSANA